MPEMLSLTTRLDRNDLTQFLPDLRAVKAFEALAKDVSTTLPDAINGNTAAVDSMAEAWQAAQDAATSARAAADRVLRAAALIEDLLQLQRSDRSALLDLKRRVDDLESLFLNRRR